MMLATSTAIQASSPTERPFPRSMQIVKAAFFVAQNAFHRDTHFNYSISSPFHYLRTIIAREQLESK